MTRDPDDSVLEQTIRDREQERADWGIAREERRNENYGLGYEPPRWENER